MEAFQEAALLVLLPLARYQVALQVAKVATVLLVHKIFQLAKEDLLHISFHRLPSRVRQGEYCVLSFPMAFATELT